MAKRPAKSSGKPTRTEPKSNVQDAEIPTQIPTGPDLSHIVAGLRPLAFPLADLVPDAGNARLHDEKNLAAIVGSLRQFGQVQAIVARASDRVILAGHGRHAAASQLYRDGDHRWAQVAVLFADWDPITGAAFAIADNRTAELADWDKAALERQLREIAIGDENLQQMFADMTEELKLVVLPEDDEPAEIEAPPERHQIVVTLADEDAQVELLERLEKEGYECRALVS